ncbi:MAG: DUF6335 family protein [Vicinamibacterales bacterium]
MAKKTAPRRAVRAARKPVRQAARKAAGRVRTALKRVARHAATSRKTAKTAVKKAVRTGSRMKKKATRQMQAAKKQVETVVQKARTQQRSVAKSAGSAMGKAANLAKAVKAGVTAALTPPAAPAGASRARHKRPPTLDRERKTVHEIHGVPSSLGAGAVAASAAKSGRDDLRQKLERHTSSSPALTAGDVDADWESADSSGDEAPGGDNPTPDQDVVDEIGRALGVEYDDDEELQGGDEIADRDRHRWELDPNSAEDSDDRE